MKIREGIARIKESDENKLNDMERFRTTTKVRKQLNLLMITYDFKRKHDLIAWMLDTFVEPEKNEERGRKFT